MSFIAIDGFDDRYNLNNYGDFDDGFDGWDLYPEVSPSQTGLYFSDYWDEDTVPRPLGRYGGYCVMAPDPRVSYELNYLGHLTDGATHFSGGIAVNSLDDDCEILFGVVDNVSAPLRRYGPSLETDATGNFILRRSLSGSRTTEIIQRSLKTARMTMWGWHYITFQFVCEGLGTDWIKVWCDGELVIDYTGVLNYSGTLDWLECPGNSDAIDDLWLRNDTNVIAEPMIPAIFPDGAGTDTECTPVGSANNWENVDEFEQDFDSSYNLVDTGEKDSFNMGSLSAQVSAGVVHALCARFFVWGDAGNALQLRPYVIVNSTKYNGTAQAVTEGYWRYIQEIWEVNPDTSVAWTVSDIDAVEIGYEAV